MERISDLITKLLSQPLDRLAFVCAAIFALSTIVEVTPNTPFVQIATRGLSESYLSILFTATFLVVALFLNLRNVSQRSRRISPGVEHTRRIVVVPSVSGEKPFPPFYSALFEHMLCYAQTKGEYEIIFHLPHVSYDPNFQEPILNEIADGRIDADAVVLVCTKETSLKTENMLKQFYHRIGDSLPLVFLDVKVPFSKIGLPVLPYVSSDETVGGHEVAKAFRHYFSRRSIRDPKVAIISPNYQKGRVVSFQEMLKNYFPQAEFYKFPEIRSDRKLTRDECRQFLLREGSPKIINGFFCFNDEMAIGVQDALLGLGDRVHRDTIVIGYDGLRETKYRLGNDYNRFFLHTVDVSLQEQASAVIDLTITIMAGDKLAQLEHLIKPSLYPPLRAD